MIRRDFLQACGAVWSALWAGFDLLGKDDAPVLDPDLRADWNELLTKGRATHDEMRVTFFGPTYSGPLPVDAKTLDLGPGRHIFKVSLHPTYARAESCIECRKVEWSEIQDGDVVYMQDNYDEGPVCGWMWGPVNFKSETATPVHGCCYIPGVLDFMPQWDSNRALAIFPQMKLIQWPDKNSK